jgi:hypothetical protein
VFLLQTSIKIWDLESKSVVDDLRPEFSKTYGRKAIEPYCVSLAWSADGGTLFAGECLLGLFMYLIEQECGLGMWAEGVGMMFANMSLCSCKPHGIMQVLLHLHLCLWLYLRVCVAASAQLGKQSRLTGIGD